MAPKTCVHCMGEAAPCGPARKATGGKYTRLFRCKDCGQAQSKTLEPTDPYAGHASANPPGAPRTPTTPRKRKPKPPQDEDRNTGRPAASAAIRLTPALASARPTPRSLADHNYQRKLAAHYAPFILPSTFQALRTGVEAGNAQIIKHVLELYELVSTDKRVSIVNDNRTVNVDARGGENDGAPQRRSFESTARMLEAAREKRISQGNPLATRMVEAEFAATPEGTSK